MEITSFTINAKGGVDLHIRDSAGTWGKASLADGLEPGLLEFLLARTNTGGAQNDPPQE